MSLLDKTFSFLLRCFFQVSLSSCVASACLPILLCSGGAHAPYSVAIKLCWLGLVVACAFAMILATLLLALLAIAGHDLRLTLAYP